MPKWIHDRARHIQAKNPGMSEQVAFAVATQQAHKLKKTPKGFGTKEGKKKALAKFDKPRKDYTKGADPKGIGKELDAKLQKRAELISPNNPMLAEREERSLAPWVIGGAAAGATAAAQESKDPATIGFGAVMGALAMAFGSKMLTQPKVKEAAMSDALLPYMDSFSDELQKIASAPGLGRRALEAVRSAGGRGGELIRGGKKNRLVSHLKGKTDRPVKSLTGIEEASIAKRKGNTDKLREIRKVQAARGGAALGAGAAAHGGVKKHRKTERRQLGKAYVTGARDMYGQLLRSQYGRGR